MQIMRSWTPCLTETIRHRHRLMKRIHLHHHHQLMKSQLWQLSQLNKTVNDQPAFLVCSSSVWCLTLNYTVQYFRDLGNIWLKASLINPINTKIYSLEKCIVSKFCWCSRVRRNRDIFTLFLPPRSGTKKQITKPMMSSKYCSVAAAYYCSRYTYLIRSVMLGSSNSLFDSIRIIFWDSVNGSTTDEWFATNIRLLWTFGNFSLALLTYSCIASF